jgi:hypothetical protein
MAQRIILNTINCQKFVFSGYGGRNIKGRLCRGQNVRPPAWPEIKYLRSTRTKKISEKKVLYYKSKY